MSCIDLNARADATKRTLAKYRDRPFDWKNRSTCVHMAAAHIRNLGHRPRPVPTIRSALSAKRALKNEGFNSLSELLDSLLPPISPAAAIVGDLASIEGDDGFDAIIVCSGSKWLGWHAQDPSGLKPLVVSQFKGAWRV